MSADIGAGALDCGMSQKLEDSRSVPEPDGKLSPSIEASADVPELYPSPKPIVPPPITPLDKPMFELGP